MSNRLATRATLRAGIRQAFGLPYRGLVRRAWEFSTDECWRYQAERFATVYDFARGRVPYYRERLDAYPPYHPQRDELLEFLAKLPVLTKPEVRQHNKALWPSPRLPLTTYHSTSGTTGTPLRLPATLFERALSEAIESEWLLRTCGTRWPRALYLSGFMTPSPDARELFWIDRIFGHAYLSIYSINDANRAAIEKLITDRVKPRLIMGYASAVYQLAACLGDSQREDRHERVAIVTSEVLEPAWREAIEANLCHRVYDLYGSQEGCHRVLDDGQGHMGICPLQGIVELLTESGDRAKAGDVGRVVVTGLVRRSMPLIRYEIGDAAESTGYGVPEGAKRRWPTIGRVLGRAEDLVRTRDGRRIGMLSYVTMKDLAGIKESQIRQTDYEHFICTIVPSGDAQRADLECAIRGQLEKRLQTRLDLEFRYVDEIPRGPNGKFKALVVDFSETVS